MASQFSLPYQLPPIDLIPPQAGGSAITSTNYVSLRNALKAWLVVKVNQGNAATVAITPVQATSLAGAGSKALGNSGLVSQPGCQIWLNDATASSDLLVAQSNALNFTTDANVAAKEIIFEIVPEEFLDIPNGFNHLGVTIGASNAANIVTATLHIYGSFQGQSQPTSFV